MLLEVCKGDQNQLKEDAVLYLILMADILTTSGTPDEGCIYLEDAWLILKRGRENTSYGKILLIIAEKVFTQMFSNLQLVERHTLLIFSTEFEFKYASDVDETMRDEVKELLWTLGPTSFFDATVHKVEWYKDRKISENVATFNHNERIDILEAGCQVQLFFNLFTPIDFRDNGDHSTIKSKS